VSDHYFHHSPAITLTCRRCAACNRYYASEQNYGWQCGACLKEFADRRLAEIETLTRRVNALRGALKRKGQRK
jgi:uncharacterized OB-fold protein